MNRAEEEIEKEQLNGETEGHENSEEEDSSDRREDHSSKPVVEEDDTPLPAELKMDEYDDESDVEIDLFENNDADDDNIEMEVSYEIISFDQYECYNYFHFSDYGTWRHSVGN